MSNSDKSLSCVCCPKCGLVAQKSILTVSSFCCERCHTKFLGIVQDGMVTTVLVDEQSREKPMEESLLHFQKKMSEAAGQ